MRYFFLLFILITSCTSDSEDLENPDVLNIKILSLGDSYTLGEGVCENCNYPNQLIDSLKTLNPNDNFNLDIIAQTGWSTTALINNINNHSDSSIHNHIDNTIHNNINNNNNGGQR